MEWRIKMAGVRRPSFFLSAVFILAVGCCWPLLRSVPPLGAWAVAVAAGYWSAALLTVAANDLRIAAWLLGCGLLWAGSTTDAVRPLTVAAIGCWVGGRRAATEP